MHLSHTAPIHAMKQQTYVGSGSLEYVIMIHEDSLANFQKEKNHHIPYNIAIFQDFHNSLLYHDTCS